MSGKPVSFDSGRMPTLLRPGFWLASAKQESPWDWGGYLLAEVLRLAARVEELESEVAASEELKLLRAWESAMLRWFDNDGGYVSVRLNSAEEDAKIAEEEAWTALCAFRERNKQEEKEG